MTQLPRPVLNILSVCSKLDSPPSEPLSFSQQEGNALTYISGHIALKISSQVCDTCHNKIIQDRDDESDESFEFTMNLKNENAKDGLIIANKTLVDAFL